MAGWLRGRTKLSAILGLLKDQTATTLARTSGPFSHLQVAIVMATNHDESLPEEKYVEEIIAAGAGPRLQVSFCTQLLVKRLTKTQNWLVAIKCLVILHRCILDGSFLYQDLLAHVSMKEGKEYLNFGKFRLETASVKWKYCVWVKNYARYLDERLICSRALKSHFDKQWSPGNTQNRMEYMDSEELLCQLEALQNLLQELCQCEPEWDPGEHPVIQGALVLVVNDSFRVYDEIRFRFKEMLLRVNLPLSMSLSLLHCCKRAGVQMQSLERFLENCKELRLFSDIPFPGIDMVSELEVQKLTETIQSTPVKPSGPLYTKRSASVGRKVLGGDDFREPFNNGLPGQGSLQRASSQRMSLPRAMNRSQHRHSSSAAQDLQSGAHSDYDLIDLSFASEHPTGNRSNNNNNAASVPLPAHMQDLITF